MLICFLRAKPSKAATLYCKYYNQANMAAVLYQAYQAYLTAAGGINNKTKKEDVTGEKSRSMHIYISITKIDDQL